MYETPSFVQDHRRSHCFFIPDHIPYIALLGPRPGPVITFVFCFTPPLLLVSVVAVLCGPAEVMQGCAVLLKAVQAGSNSKFAVTCSRVDRTSSFAGDFIDISVGVAFIRYAFAFAFTFACVLCALDCCDALRQSYRMAVAPSTQPLGQPYQYRA